MIRRRMLTASLMGLTVQSERARAAAGGLVTIGGAVTETVFALDRKSVV